jgi:hypothetical protein
MWDKSVDGDFSRSHTVSDRGKGVNFGITFWVLVEKPRLPEFEKTQTAFSVVAPNPCTQTDR